MRRPLLVVPLALSLGLLSLTGTAQAAPRHRVVVMGPGDASAAVRHAGGTVERLLPLLHGAVAELPVGARLPGFVVSPDRALTPSGRPERGRGKGQPELPSDEGAGTGVTVAVVDTGVADVPELAGRVTHVDVTGDGVGDGYGHGTFVAGLVAGSSVGAAPGADVLDVRVGHDDGSTSLVDVLVGLEVVASHPEVRVLNLSLSSGSPVEVDPLTIALDQLWASGVLVVVPAGNDGPGRETVTSPGTDPLLLTVGGLDTAGTADRGDDSVAAWSGQGGQGLQKPDLVAPGAHVVSAAAPGSAIWTANPGSRVDGGLFVGSGSSFSAALVSGSAAAVLAQRPELTPDRVKALLERSAYDVAGPRRATGAGGLDAARAMTQRAPHAVQPVPESDDLLWDASSWAASSWAARQWAARQWAARQWAASSWAASSWAARQWAARQWSARQWSAVGWE